MDIWVTAPSSFKGLNGMNQPDQLSAMLYKMNVAFADFTIATLETPYEQYFGTLMFYDVPFEMAEKLCRRLNQSRRYNLHQEVQFVFETESERNQFRTRLITGGCDLWDKRLRLLIPEDIQRAEEHRQKIVDEFTESTESSLLMPSHPENDA